MPKIGDGVIVGFEICDDLNSANNDGCSSSGQIEKGYTCSGIPSVCSHFCGNGLIHPSETCDDKNSILNDGCSEFCQIENGF